MPATLMLVFIGQGREVHLPVQQVEITSHGINTENGKIAIVSMSPGMPTHYRLIKNPYVTADGVASNYGDEPYESIRVHRLMPTGEQLERALEQFETDTLPSVEMGASTTAIECPECKGIGQHCCAWREPVTNYVCGVSKVNHNGIGHTFVRCIHAYVSRH